MEWKRQSQLQRGRWEIDDDDKYRRSYSLSNMWATTAMTVSDNDNDHDS